MTIKASDIPDSAITQAGSNSQDIYYKCGKDITVVSSKNRNNEWYFLCLTCIKTDDCAHSRAVRRFCGHPKKRTYYEDDAA